MYLSPSRGGAGFGERSFGVQSQMSDMSTALSLRSTLSVPARVRDSVIVTRVMETCRLQQRREFEAGRARRIAECYREKLDDIQRERSALPAWCKKQAYLASASTDSLHDPATAAKPSFAEMRTDSSYVADEADPMSVFLQVATNPPPSPAKRGASKRAHDRAIDECGDPLDVGATVDEPIRHAVTVAPSTPPRAAISLPSTPLHHHPRPASEPAAAAPRVQRKDIPDPPPLDDGAMQRLANVFPFHAPAVLAKALYDSDGDEFAAIAVLLKSEDRGRPGLTPLDQATVASPARSPTSPSSKWAAVKVVQLKKAKHGWKRIKAMLMTTVRRP
ncbi:hypothetical protein H9P43_004464 [Blastocladiella emersonii ATCC 22665]|nr:hypothetical protein H9P43_004464 [Blastocladiella emersonii ATCC 22665]